MLRSCADNTNPCVYGSQLTISLAVLAGLGGAFTLLVLTISCITFKIKFKNQLNISSSHGRESVVEDFGVVYDEVNQQQMAAQTEIFVQKNSAYAQVSLN